MHGLCDYNAFLPCCQYTGSMISLLVSSKTMKPTACTLAVEESQPVFREEADALNALLKAKSPLQLRRLMHISPKIADSTY